LTLDHLRTRLREARRITVLTGAGVSAASGVPTFRGAGGLWRNRQATQLATPEAFARDPALVWEWYAWRRQVIAGCEPNAAHRVIARWSTRDGFTLVTQNVDGLHERAGTRNVVRYHGSIWRLRCTATEFDFASEYDFATEYTDHTRYGLATEYTDHTEYGFATEYTEHTGYDLATDYTEHTEYRRGGTDHPVEWDDLRVPLDPLPPKCPRCGALARPGVVWFGEAIPAAAARAAQAATACDVFLSIGTSSVVYPAAGLLADAKARGAFTVEINPETTGAAVDLAIAAPAEDILPQLV
jgi:NAD-dependent SIR2 family protein deacetylase